MREEEINKISRKFEKEAKRTYRHKNITFEVKTWMDKLK